MILGLPEFDLKNVRKQKKICQVWRADSFRITNPLQQHPWARGGGLCSSHMPPQRNRKFGE